MSAGAASATPAHRAGWRTVRVGPECTACGACLATCPTRALLPAPGRPAVHDGRCIACGECIEVCPRGAVVEATG